MKKRFTEAEIVGFLREADAGIPVKELWAWWETVQDINFQAAAQFAFAQAWMGASGQHSGHDLAVVTP
ncbi:MAG: hypothetical protein EXQ69_06420, partial [Acidimicrobiia bacterium]|nr:hypothetical protein [Acidimicrobiia bacterium]